MAKKKKTTTTTKLPSFSAPSPLEATKMSSSSGGSSGSSSSDLGVYAKVNVSNTKTKCSKSNTGFYYDSQLVDPFLSISLHANTVKKGNEWVWYTGETLDPVSDSEGSTHYMAEPLARCIMPEDLVYSIGNNFTDWNGGNMLESMFESFKPYAPILSKAAEGLEKGAGEVDKENNFGGAIVKTLGNFAKGAAPWMKSASQFLNKALLVQGTRFAYYNGTSFNFNNLEMKYTVFSDYIADGSFLSVEDYIKKIAPYVMGEYHPVTNYLKTTGNATADKFLHDYVGFQDPPAGFTMDTKNLNNVLKGTMRLNIGGLWAIENLVIKNMNVVLSKVQAKDPIIPGNVIPMYADITLQLAPASMIVDTGYSNIVNHKGLVNIRDAAKESYASELETLKTNLKSELNV